MPARKAPRKGAAASSAAAVDTAEQLRRIANLVALLATKGESQTNKVLTLTGAGFTNAEVADLLHVTQNVVGVTLHRGKRAPKKKATKKTRKSR